MLSGLHPCASLVADIAVHRTSHSSARVECLVCSAASRRLTAYHIADPSPNIVAPKRRSLLAVPSSPDGMAVAGPTAFCALLAHSSQPKSCMLNAYPACYNCMLQLHVMTFNAQCMLFCASLRNLCVFKHAMPCCCKPESESLGCLPLAAYLADLLVCMIIADIVAIEGKWDFCVFCSDCSCPSPISACWNSPCSCSWPRPFHGALGSSCWRTCTR